MRPILCWVILWLGLAVPASAQPEAGSAVPAEARRATSDARAAEVKADIEKAKRRQKAIDTHNTDLWTRWAYAVCIGCGPIPKKLRVVHTTPARVLAGIPAAQDDARARDPIRSRRGWASLPRRARSIR